MKTLALILALAAAWPVVAQTTYKINQLTELAAAPADTDWLIIWDTSAATSKKISRANFLAGGIIPESFGLTDPGADRLLFWDESAGVYRHLTLGTGLSISDTTLNAEAASATVTLPAARIAYGAADNTLTSESGFEYDATFNNLRVPTMVSIGATGSAFAMYTTGSGSLTMFNDFTDETLIWNLGVGGANTAFLSSDSGVNLFDFGTIDLKVPTEVYDSTNWNGDLTVPTKDAVRDKIEALTVGSAGLTATYVGYGDGSNALTGEAAFSYNSSTNTLTVENATFTNLNTTDLNADSFLLVEESGAGTQTLEIQAASSYTANRSLFIYTGDNDTDLTIPSAGTLTMAAATFANAWGDGVKQTFNPNGTNAGINVGSQAGDPSSPANGDLWYDSTANELTARINGANVALGAGGGGGTLASTYVGYGDGSNVLTGESVFTYNATSNTLTVPNVDSSSGTATVGPLKTSDGVNLLNERTIYGAGTAYTLTGTAAAVDMGTTDPVVTINSVGTYLIQVRVLLNYAAATVSAETATIKLRRTNNTAGDVTGATTTIDLPVATTLTHSYGVVTLPPVIYTTLNTDDSLTIFGNVSAALSAGSIQVGECSIVALRIR